MLDKKINGLIAAPFSPMNDDGSVNLGVINTYAQKLKRDQVKGVFVCGTTGEGMSLTVDERKQILQEWTKFKGDDFYVIAHVGTTSSKESFHLAKHAQEKGADAIATVGPLFLGADNVDTLVGFCAEIACGASDLPFYYYHIPSVSGVDLKMASFIEEAGRKIPNFRGIKFTHNNFVDMLQCLEADNEKWEILHGYDELLLTGLTLGASGAVGSTYNYIANLYMSIIGSFRENKLNEARAAQLISVKLVDILNKYGGATVAGKALMKYAGVDCGPCRSPLTTLNDDAYNKLIEEIEKLALFNPETPGA